MISKTVRASLVAEPLQLSARDKAAVQRVTRYADIGPRGRYEFSIRHGQILFIMPGTTSRAWFTDPGIDPQEAERYLGRLAAFAFVRLGKKYPHSARMIHPDVFVIWNEKRYQLNLGELVREATGFAIQELV